jgi:hypothetical protein
MVNELVTLPRLDPKDPKREFPPSFQCRFARQFTTTGTVYRHEQLSRGIDAPRGCITIACSKLLGLDHQPSNRAINFGSDILP